MGAQAKNSGKTAKPSDDKKVTQEEQGSERFISIDFNNVDINVFIKFISELTSRNFVVDQRVRGKVTIISPSKISVKEAYKVFESVLEVHGFTTIRSGQVTKIVPSPDARSKNIETRLKEEAASPEDRVVTQLIPLKFASSSEIKKLFAPLVSKSSVILDYPPTNMIIITDVYSNIKRLLRILKAIDVAGMGQELSVIPLEYAEATKFVKILDSIFQERKRSRAQSALSDTKFVADERTNTIIFMASEVETI
ncbi:MAG: type II secretion system protein GspD, partial [Deltaproteobacteria bacterium]|nr:type II secretion system protein GspD [Deltaproteobacteria bacterium]